MDNVRKFDLCSPKQKQLVKNYPTKLVSRDNVVLTQNFCIPRARDNFSSKDAISQKESRHIKNVITNISH